MTRYHNGTRVPDFFIVGHPKCGTTALYEMLRQHPELFMPAVKEPLFLAKEMRLPGSPETLDEYLSLFADARDDQRAGEASPLYMVSHTAPAAIAELNPHARIIAVFREPADFLRSLHFQLLRNRVEARRDLRRAIALEEDRSHGGGLTWLSNCPPVPQYSEHLHYTEQLTRYRAFFSSEQILVLIYEEFKADNAGSLRKVLGFLGVEDSIPITPVQANPTVAIRSQAFEDAVFMFSVGHGPYSRAVKAVIKTLLSQRVRRRLLQAVQENVVHSPPPPVDEELMRELRMSVKPEVERFSEVLQRDLVRLWGYDDVTRA